MRRFIYLLVGVWLFVGLAAYANAQEKEPITVNAIITASEIRFEPAAIPENTPFIIHVINQAGSPVELENSDTSVEVYVGTDKTFKIGLSAGKYKFFNDFNPKTKTAELEVLTPAQMTTAENLAKLNSSAGNSKVDNNNNTEVSNSNTAAQATNSSLAEVVFIMWRECIEALLVVGIVFNWLNQLKTGRKEGMLFLAGGVGLGVLCALLLGFILVELSGELSGNASEYLQAGLTFLAAIMIVYMVKWMRKNSRKLKSEMSNALMQHEARRWNISILMVVTVAIAREGSEAVIFIYALGFGEHGVVSASMLGAVLAGLGLAVVTVYLFSLGNKLFSWRYFFKITETLLLLLGGALLLNCVDLLVSAGLLPVLKAKIWDTSFVLSDGGRFVPILTSLIGYRATPSLIDIMVYLLYWLLVLWFIKVREPSTLTKA